MWLGVVSTLLIEAVIGVIVVKYVGVEEIVKMATQIVKSFSPDSMSVEGKVAVISFTHDQQDYKLLLPYSTTLGGGRVVSSNTTFTSPSGEIILEDRHPCLPICVTPGDLGYRHVTRENEFEDDHKVIEQHETIGY